MCYCKQFLHVGQEFQAVFLSTTEPLDAHGNTSNPTKSPCDRYVFNTVLTRARSLVVVVGSPLVLLNIEAHMVRLYGNKGKCWSVYLKKCLEKNTFIIPPCVGDSERQREQFKAKLASDLGVKGSVLVSHPRSVNSARAQHPVKHLEPMKSPKAKSPSTAQQRQKKLHAIAADGKSQSSKAAQPSIRHDNSMKSITSLASNSKPVLSKSISKPSHTPTMTFQADNKLLTIKPSSTGGTNPQVDKIHSEATSKNALPAANPREKASPKTKTKFVPIQHQKTPPNKSIY